jgi:hypothetical protein
MNLLLIAYLFHATMALEQFHRKRLGHKVFSAYNYENLVATQRKITESLDTQAPSALPTYKYTQQPSWRNPYYNPGTSVNADEGDKLNGSAKADANDDCAPNKDCINIKYNLSKTGNTSKEGDLIIKIDVDLN